MRLTLLSEAGDSDLPDGERGNYYFKNYVNFVLRMILLVAVIQMCACLLPFSEGQADSNSPMHITTYENPAYGIKFNYPVSWNLTENLTQTSIALIPKNDSIVSRMNVAINDVPKNMTVDKYGEALVQEQEKKISRFISTTSATGRPYQNTGTAWAKNFTFTGLYMGIPVKGVTMYTVYDNKSYVLTFICQRNLYPQFFPEAKVLVDSFEIYRDLKNKEFTIGTPNMFNGGVIDFDAKFDNSYGGNASMRIRLDDLKTNGVFRWSIYHNNSMFFPNTYLIEQKVNDTWTSIRGSLNQTIEYGKWYHVRLLINESNVSFYLDDKIAATFKRPSHESYSYLQLVTESAAASFMNVHEFTSSRILDPLLDPANWYSEEGTFQTKKTGDNTIFTLVPIYPPLGVQSVQPSLNDINLTVEKVVTGLNFPTDMAFLGPNDILITEKNTGEVKRIVNGKILPEPMLDVNVANKNERGMLGIATAKGHPLNQSEKNDTKNTSNNGTFVFLYFTESKDKDGEDAAEGKEPLGNRLYRYEFLNNRLVNPKLLLDLPTTTSAMHNGGKILIGADNNAYIAVGNLDKNDSKAQNSLNGGTPDGTGGILRISMDGRPVKNILGENHLEKYYAYGIRNSFGIIFDPISGQLWDTENGPAYGDEINLVSPGFNSGWKDVQGVWTNENGQRGRVYDDFNELETFNAKGHYSDPEFIWQDPVGVTNLIFLNSSKLGKYYENDMFVGDFHYGYIYHFKLNKNRTGLLLEAPLNDKIANSFEELKKVIFGTGFGGITDLELGPDGYIYVLAVNVGGGNCDPNFPTDICIPYNGKNFGTLFKIVPVKVNS